MVRFRPPAWLQRPLYKPGSSSHDDGTRYTVKNNSAGSQAPDCPGWLARPGTLPDRRLDLLFEYIRGILHCCVAPPIALFDKITLLQCCYMFGFVKHHRFIDMIVVVRDDNEGRDDDGPMPH